MTSKFFLTISICMLLSCQGNKLVKEAASSMVGRHFIVNHEYNNLITGKTFVDSFYLYLEDPKWKSYHGESWNTRFDCKNGVLYDSLIIQNRVWDYKEKKSITGRRVFKLRTGITGHWSYKRAKVRNKDSSLVLASRRSKFIDTEYLFALDSTYIKSVEFRDVSERMGTDNLTVYTFRELEEAPDQQYFKPTKSYRLEDSTRELRNVTNEHTSPSDFGTHISGPMPDTGKVIAIYSFIDCGACILLKKQLLKDVEKGKIRPEQVVIINPVDDSLALTNYLNHFNHPFPYYRAPQHWSRIKAYP